MNMVKVYIKGQEDKNLSSFLRYYPARIKNIGFDAVFDRQIIYDFKDGHNHAEVAKCVAKMLVKKYGRKIGKQPGTKRGSQQVFLRTCMQAIGCH